MGALLAGPVRPLERLDFAFVRRLDWWAHVAGPVQERLAERLPGLCTLRAPSGDGSVEWIARLVARLPALRELSVVLRSPAMGELIALAQERRLARVSLLGPIDIAFEPASSLLEFSFPNRLEPAFAKLLPAMLDRVAALGVRRVQARLPLRAILQGDEAAPLLFVRPSKKLELRALVEACAALGLPFSVEAHAEDTFAPNPTRRE